MANPQPNKFTKLSNELYEAIMKTDFTKRQRNILDLVIRLSYGCGKKFAILRPSDFEIVGVLRGHVQKELDYLQMTNVLQISGEVYVLNKDYDTWRVSISKGFNDDKYRKILSRNLSQSVTDSVTNVTETVTDFDEDFDDDESDCYQNSNTHVTKTVTGTADEPKQDAGSGVPKESIKERFKSSSSGTTSNSEAAAAAVVEDASFGRIYTIFETHFATNGKITPLEVEDLTDQFETYGGEWLLEAMREAVRHGKRTLAYINGVLNGYRERGGPQKERASPSGQAPPSPILDDDDPITRMMREEDRRQRGAAIQSA